jgi:hypothetical protein
MKQHLFAAALAAAMALAAVAQAQPAGGGAGGGGGGRAGMREACQADMQKLCPDAKPGPGGGMRECIKSNFDKLSTPCQDAINKMRAEHQGGQGGGGGQPAPQ